MNSENICIIGAGALGSRHLQAIALSKRPYNIYVLDTSEISLGKAKELFNQTCKTSFHHILFTQNMKELPAHLDIVVIATSSNVRKQVIETLLQHSKVRYFILEKVLFQKVDDYDIIGNLLVKHNIKAWVNCTRRMFDLYKELKNKLSNANSIEVNISGSQWGLGCNAIHFLDLIEYLSGSDNLVIDLSGLDRNYIDSKRKGFLEITGSITGKMGKCKNYSITSYETAGCPLTIQITSDVLKCIISEVDKKYILAEASEGWKWKENTCIIPYQSQLTHIVIQDILENDKCDLTDFNTSTNLHLNMIRPLIKYFEKLGLEEGICPIT